MHFFRVILFFLLLAHVEHESLFGAIDQHFDFSQGASSAQEPVIMPDEFPEVLAIKHIEWHLDTTLDKDELNELMGFKENADVTKENIRAGLEALKRKQKFKDLRLQAHQEAEGWNLTLTCTSVQTVRKVTVQGNVPMLEKYRNVYFLEPGHPFNQENHEKGLEYIKQVLKKEGYFNSSMHTSLGEHVKTKEVDVDITIDPGKRFTISTITATCLATDNEEDSGMLKEACKHILEPALKHEYYSEDIVKEHLVRLRTYTQSQGFSEILLRPRLMLNKTKKTVDIRLYLTARNRKVYTFSGNVYFDDAALRKTVLFFGPATPRMPPLIIAEEISTMYKNAGFLDIQVTWQEQNNACVFELVEGPRCTITDVQIEGALSFDRETLKAYFTPLLTADNYDAQALQEAYDTLTQWYLQQGFWDFSVGNETFVATPTEGKKILLIKIEEGRPRALVGVKVQAFPELLDQEPFKKYTDFEHAVPFDLTIIHEQQQHLTKHLQKNGFLYSTYKPEFIQTDRGLVIEWKLHGPDEPVTFGKTIVIGSSYTLAHVLLRELDYKEGDPWDIDAIHRSVGRLKALSMFESISLQPVDIFKPEQSKTMLLKVIEDDPFELRARLGLGFISRNIELRGGATYRVGASFLWKNVTRQADILRFDGDITRYTREAALSYRIPWIGPFPITTTFKAYTSYYDQPFVIGSPEILYNAVHTGISARIEGRSRLFDWGLNSGIEWMEIQHLSRKRAQAIKFEPALIDRTFPYYVCEPCIFFDYLDNKLNPTRGALTVFSLRSMFPFNLRHAWYLKFLAEQSCFVPLFPEVVLGIRLRMGHIFNTDFERIMPTERFYLGGAYSLRGYLPDLAPPLNIYTDASGHKHLVPIGGKSMINANFEIRFPLYKQIGGVVFTDLGALSQEHMVDIFRKDILGSSGFGLRYNTPVGALRFDIGWKWKKRFKNDRSFAWFFTLGQAF